MTIDAVNVYVASGPKAPRLCRFSQADIENGSSAPVIEYTFPAPKARKGKKKAVDDEEDSEDEIGEEKPAKKKRAPKGKTKQVMDREKDIALGSDEEEGGDQEYPNYVSGDTLDELDDNETLADGILPSSDPPEAEWAVTKPAPKKRAVKRNAKSEEVVEVSD